MSRTIVSEQERFSGVSPRLHEVGTHFGMFWNRCISLGRACSSVLPTMIRSIKEFSAKYPAVLSGYIIYSYLFITLMHFFIKAKSHWL